MNHPKVAIIILNWNGQYFLKKFLPSIYNSTYPNLEFIVGDNASTDDSLSFLSTYYPQIRVLSNDQNYGFAEGYNRIIEKAPRADYYILLNSDVEVSPNWIEPMVSYMEQHPNLAAIQPKIMAWHKRDTFEHAGAAGGFIDRWGYPFCRGRMFDHLEVDEGQYDDYREIFWATGAAFMIRSSCWKQAGGFDASFFAHMEEIDLCWRLKRMGYGIGFCPESKVYHVGGGTLHKANPKKTYLNFRNNLWMLQKNLPPKGRNRVLFIRLFMDFIALLKFVLSGKFRDAWAIHRAHVSFFKHYARMQKKRKQNKQYPYEVSEIYRGSVIWAFFVQHIKKFSALKENFL